MDNNKINEEIERIANKKDNKTQELSNTMTADWRELSKRGNLKPKRKCLKVLISILIFALIIVGVGFAYLKFFKPDSAAIYKSIFKEGSQIINKVIDSNLNRGNNSYTQNGNIAINTDIEEYKNLNGASLEYSFAYTPDSKIMSTKMLYKENEKDIINANIYVQEKNLYLQSDQIYNKLLLLGDVSEDPIIQANLTKEDIKDIGYSVKQSYEYIKNSLLNAEYETEQGTVIIKGKKNTVQKNILIINKSNVNTIKNEILNNIKNDIKISNTIKKLYNISDEQLTKLINDEIKEDASKDFSELRIELDTQFITNKILGLKIVKNDNTLFNAVSNGKKTYDVTINKKTKGELTVNNSNNIAFETKIDGCKMYVELITTNSKDSCQVTFKETYKDGKQMNVILKNNATNSKVEKLSLQEAVDISKLNKSEQDKIADNYNTIAESAALFKFFSNQDMK